MKKKYIWLLATLPLLLLFTKPTEDPYLWLEEIRSELTLSWVNAQNAITKETLEQIPDFEHLRTRILDVLNSKEKIILVQKEGPYCYHLWRDESHLKGLWRRTSLEEYAKGSPIWETVLDLDTLAWSENESWAWKGAEFLYPNADRALLFLSRGGKDAIVVREFDLEKKCFVEEGFFLPEAKTTVNWKDKDTLYVATDFGEGSLTKSGYARIVKKWSRNTPLQEAPILFECKEEDMGIYPSVSHVHGMTYECVTAFPTFFTNVVHMKKGDHWITIDKPLDVKVSFSHDSFLFLPQTEWTIGNRTFQSGSVLAIEIDRYLSGDRDFSILFSPNERSALVDVEYTQNFLILKTLDNMKNHVTVWKKENGSWEKGELEAPQFGTLNILGIDPNESDDYFLITSDYLTPTSLWMGNLQNKSLTKIQSLPSFFSVDDLEIQQHEAISKDGTRVPYFQVNCKNISLDGKNPTLLYGYGGFQISLTPTYSSLRGIGWLEQGGIFIEANIRGGGEFGPDWHNAARKENRQRAFDDFTAVAEDLINRKVTSPDHLGIQGGSNGGLLMGVMLTQRPDLYKAVLCQVPLLDMLRYHKLLAGASWIDEYGDPDKEEERAYLQKYSPYHNLKKTTQYPHIFFTTSTRDDRVHPGHARKMAAKMLEFGHNVLYYENTEGGHAGAVNNNQIAYKTALEYAFLTSKLRY